MYENELIMTILACCRCQVRVSFRYFSVITTTLSESYWSHGHRIPFPAVSQCKSNSHVFLTNTFLFLRRSFIMYSLVNHSAEQLSNVAIDTQEHHG